MSTASAKIVHFGPEQIRIEGPLDTSTMIRPILKTLPNLPSGGDKTRVVFDLHGFEESGVHLFIRVCAASAAFLKKSSIPVEKAETFGRVVGGLAALADEAEDVLEVVGQILEGGIELSDVMLLDDLAAEVADPAVASLVIQLSQDLRDL